MVGNDWLYVPSDERGGQFWWGGQEHHFRVPRFTRDDDCSRYFIFFIIYCNISRSRYSILFIKVIFHVRCVVPRVVSWFSLLSLPTHDWKGDGKEGITLSFSGSSFLYIFIYHCMHGTRE